LKTKDSIDRMDPGFRRLSYVRYADDWIIGIRGSRKECIFILDKCRKFLETELSLELS